MRLKVPSGFSYVLLYWVRRLATSVVTSGAGGTVMLGRTLTFEPEASSTNWRGRVGAPVTLARLFVAAAAPGRLVPGPPESTTAAATAGTVIDVATSTRQAAVHRPRRTRPRRSRRECARRAKSTPTGPPGVRPSVGAHRAPVPPPRFVGTYEPVLCLRAIRETL